MKIRFIPKYRKSKSSLKEDSDDHELNSQIQEIFESPDFTKYVETIASLEAVNPYAMKKHREEFCSKVKSCTVQRQQLNFNDLIEKLNKLILERDQLDQYLRTQSVQSTV